MMPRIYPIGVLIHRGDKNLNNFFWTLCLYFVTKAHTIMCRLTVLVTYKMVDWQIKFGKFPSFFSLNSPNFFLVMPNFHRLFYVMDILYTVWWP